ncbi:hypothetical protein ACUXVT_11530 [Acinetobacter soli]|uniref:hypothetical protein n=1 Tax=Acinetobacter soli TaxID=487316 RepID=UPI0040559E54
MKRLNEWWHGKEKFPKKKPGDPIRLNPFIKIERHWSSNFFHLTFAYLKKNQNWILPTVITAVISIILARPWQ